MIDAPKTTLLNNIDDLDLTFIEGENELEFDIDDYSFVVTYSLEADDIFIEDEEDAKGGKKLKVLSINAYDNVEDEDIDVNVDDDLQKLFSDYYNNTLMDENFEPLNVNFGEFSEFLDD
jgi:hypothetical protein